MASPIEPDQDDVDDSWILNLQEFLDTFEPQTRALSSSQIVELLSNLESTDVNFHRYTFVNQLKDKLEQMMGPLIQELLDKQLQQHNSDNVLVCDISENIIQSKQFLLLANNITESVKMAAENIAVHLSSDTFDFSEMPKSDTKNSCYYNEGSTSSMSDGVEYMFMAPHKYNNLAKEIEPSQSMAVRITAFRILQQVPQTDLLASEAWKATRKGLLIALDDNEEEINSQALKFISALFVSGSSHVVREYFLILVENLYEYFNDDTSHMISIDTGLDLGDRRNVLLLRKFRLLNQIQKELPTYWLRYSDTYIEEMTDSLFELLQLTPTPISATVGKNLMSPVHFLSLLDPQAIWFRYWMHGCYGRSNVIKCMLKKREFLDKPVQCCMDFSKHLNGTNDSEILYDDDDYVSYSCDDISYMYFLHSLSMISKLILYKDGQNLFSSKYSTSNANIKKILLTFLKILKVCPLKSLNVTKSLFHPAFLIVDIFRSIANSGKRTCQIFLCNDDICHSLATLINDLLEKPNSGNEQLIDIVAEILTIIASTELGRLHLLYSDMSHELHDTKNAVIHTISNALLKQNAEVQLSSNTLISLVSLCREIFVTPDGLLVLQKYDLVEKMFTYFFEKQKHTQILLNKFNETCNLENEVVDVGSGSDRSQSNAEYIAYKRSFKLEHVLLDNLLSFTITPKGVELVAKAGSLPVCVLYLCDKYHFQQRGTKVEKFDYTVLVNQIAATTPGILALDKTGYVTDLLQETWHHLEGYSNDYTKTVLSDVPEDLTNLEMKRLFTNIIQLLSSFSAVQNLCNKTNIELSDPTDDKSCDDKLQLNGILNFSDFMEYLVLITSVKKKRLLYHPEQTHFFALNVLHCVTTCLDSMLLLQSKFHFRDGLLSLQADEELSDQSFSIDQCSVKRNQILVQVNLLGGPNERKLPSDSLTQDKMLPYPWTLFSSYPVPHMYVAKMNKPSVTDQTEVNAKIKQLVRDTRTKISDSSDENINRMKDLNFFFKAEVRSEQLKMTNENLPDLLLIAVDILLNNKRTNKLKVTKETTSNIGKWKLGDSDELAIDMIVRYGLHLRLLRSKTESIEALRTLIQDCRSYRNAPYSDGYENFDWFAAIIFVLFDTSAESASSFLKKFSTTPQSMYLWPARFNHTTTDVDIHPIFFNSCHYIELILQKELPLIHAAFRLSGYPPSQICQQWLRQCFLNYLDWEDIVFYICACIILGIDHQLYFAAAILKHMERDILYYTQKNELVLYLKTSSIQGFRARHYLQFMEDLEGKYRSVVMEHMMIT